MDYYEELGLTRSASSEEIRQAYRRVARLLHPDYCTDGEARRLAELQMKRLNGMVAVLTDGTARAAYDERLPARLPAGPRRCGFRQGRGVVAIAVVLLVGVLWFWPRRTVSVEMSPASTPETVDIARQPKRSPRSRRVTRSNRHSDEPNSPVRASEASVAPALPEEPIPLASQPAPFPPVLAAPVPSAPPQPFSDSLAGEWLYIPQIRAAKTELYPPEYVELRIVEEEGILSGRYRARYRVSDRAISPNVAFHFRGRAGSERSDLPWSGPGGAQGAITLHRLGNGTLEVTWIADCLGSELGLVSGTCVLVRKQE